MGGNGEKTANDLKGPMGRTAESFTLRAGKYPAPVAIFCANFAFYLQGA